MGIKGLSTNQIDFASPGAEWGERRDLLHLQPGRITELIGDPGSGLTRLGLGLLASFSRSHTVVAVDTRGLISPEAAWETGVISERFVVVRCDSGHLWPKVTSALLEGVQAMYVEVPTHIKERELRRLGAIARARRVAVAMRPIGGPLPGGVSYLRLRVLGVTWEGADQGHGRLTRRRLLVEASGKGASGVTRRFEVEDEGKGALRLVPDVVIGSTGRLVG